MLLTLVRWWFQLAIVAMISIYFSLANDCDVVYFIKYYLVGGFKHFFHNIWDKPSHWLSYFSRWLKPPTIYIYIHYVYIITHHISLYSIITHDIPMVFGEFPGGLQLNSCSQALHPTWACASFGWPRFGDAVNVE